MLDQAAHFGSPRPGAVPLRGLTYQAMCRTGDPGGAIREAARHRLAAERAAALGDGASVEAVLAEFAGYDGSGVARLDRDIAKVTAGLKRDLARDAHLGDTGHELLSDAAARRLGELRTAGVGTVLVDELLSLWGYVVRLSLPPSATTST